MNTINSNDTIVALATAAGTGAIAVIRLSGTDAIPIADKLFISAKAKNKSLLASKTHTLHFGTINDNDKVVDEVIVSVMKSPHSYTGEDTIEISCHGSPYVQQKILQLCRDAGARLAGPGEFTMRAFLNGKMDLSQAEAVADLIASESAAAHKQALHQMRGGFSIEINALRDRLIHFASMVELELDFAEEDVEFANRDQLNKLLLEIEQSGCNDIRQQFSFIMFGNFKDTPNDDIWKQLAVKHFRDLANISPSLFAFNGWADAIESVKDKLKLSEPMDLEGKTQVRIDKILSSDKATLVVQFSSQ